MRPSRLLCYSYWNEQHETVRQQRIVVRPGSDLPRMWSGISFAFVLSLFQIVGVSPVVLAQDQGQIAVSQHVQSAKTLALTLMGPIPDGKKVALRPFHLVRGNILPDEVNEDLYHTLTNALSESAGGRVTLLTRRLGEVYDVLEEHYSETQLRDLLRDAQADIEILCRTNLDAGSVKLSCEAVDIAPKENVATGGASFPLERRVIFKLTMFRFAERIAKRVPASGQLGDIRFIEKQSDCESDLAVYISDQLEGPIIDWIAKQVQQKPQALTGDEVATPPPRSYDVAGVIWRHDEQNIELQVRLIETPGGRKLGSDYQDIEVSILPSALAGPSAECPGKASDRSTTDEDRLAADNEAGERKQSADTAKEARQPRPSVESEEVMPIEKQPGEEFQDCDECPMMVVVPAGSYMMGSPSSEKARDESEGPVHRVTIREPFAVGVYEVTRQEFSRFVFDTGHDMGDSCQFFDAKGRRKTGSIGWLNPGYRQTEQDPVVCISWKDTRRYVAWLRSRTGKQYRLLSESEWEYVARAGKTTPFHTGVTISTDEANYNGRRSYGSVPVGEYRKRTTPVGTFWPNAFGLYDVHGNVWEWVEDCWNDSYEGASEDGRAWETGNCFDRVLRGGSWDTEGPYLRVTRRLADPHGSRTYSRGLRVALTLAVEVVQLSESAEAIEWADHKDYNKAKLLGTAEAYGEYLGEYPDGRHAAEARRLQAEAVAEQALMNQPGRRFRECDECPQMVVVPAGSYLMGSPASEVGRQDHEGPIHLVAINQPFAVGAYEVTREEFSHFVSETGYSMDDSCGSRDGARVTRVDGWRDPGYRQTEQDPVVCVSWYDAQRYVSWLRNRTGKGYRLLSESEWEYVARAATTTPFHTGATISTDKANYNGNYKYGSGQEGEHRERTTQVGTFWPNAFGLYDVHGNVAEWVEDCWNDSYEWAPRGEDAWENGECRTRMVRGGSWIASPSNIRAATRGVTHAGSRFATLGFRISRSLSINQEAWEQLPELEQKMAADEAAFGLAALVGTSAAYAEYLNEYGSGRYAAVARHRDAAARDDEAYERAKSSGTAAAYEEYLRTYEKGRHVEEARHLLLIAEEAVVLMNQPGRRFRDCEECPEMVVVPAGTYQMGSPTSEVEDRWFYDGEEEPIHPVTISEPFAVGINEVTFEEWDQCVNDGECGSHRPEDEGWGRGTRPVINVDWRDAMIYVAWLRNRTGRAYRLLSESEWEYVARAGTTTAFHTGASISTDQANYNGNHTYGSGQKGEYRQRTTPVGTFEPNPYGLYDVHGNVAEWVEDCWNKSYEGAPGDGSVWNTNSYGDECRVFMVRGGSWDDVPSSIRSAYRDQDTWFERKSNLGFRVARTLAS